jgi:hypothetical protein
MHEGAPIFPSLSFLSLLSNSPLQIYELLFRTVSIMAIAKTIQSLIPPAKHASARNLGHKSILGAKPNEETLLYTVNDLLVQKALSSPNVPLLAYPASLKGTDDYVHYTARDLDRFADEAAKAYMAMGLPVKVRSFYCFLMPMLINVFRRTTRMMRSSQYWHRLI